MSFAKTSFDLPKLGPPTHVGKVRDSWALNAEERLIVTTDRISAFDVVMANGIPNKGPVLNQLSAWFFREMAGVCPNHCLTIDDNEIARELGFMSSDLIGRTMLARNAKPLKIECVVRGYIAGSLFKEYRQSGHKLHGLTLPEGLRDGDPFPEPIFTPATKAETGHDENISFAQAADIVGQETAEQVRQWSLALYLGGAELARSKGLILADTKFEFGETPDGLIVIDEILTPDSSRYWDAALYQPGQSQPSFDKQFVRDYLEGVGFNKQPPGPKLPEDVVWQTAAKYDYLFRLLTNQTLVVPLPSSVR